MPDTVAEPEVQATVITEKLAATSPSATVTAAGMLAITGALLASDTDAPPVGAGALSVTVPVELLPEETVAGLRLIDERTVGGAGVTVRMAR